MPAASARRRLLSFGTDGSRKRRSGFHGIRESPHPTGRVVDHRIVAPGGEEARGPFYAERGLGPRELLQGHDGIELAPPNRDVPEGLGPRSEIGLEAAQELGGEPREE